MNSHSCLFKNVLSLYFALQSALVCCSVSLFYYLYRHLGNPQFLLKSHQDTLTFIYDCVRLDFCRSQWPCGLRRRSSAARLLRLWVRIPPGAWMFVCCECCVLSGRFLCDGLIIRPGESYRLWRVVVCELETSKTTRLKPATGL